MKTLYILRGLPGSGKSTLAKELVGSDSLIFEADKFFMTSMGYKFVPSKLGEAHKWCREKVESAMKQSEIDDKFTQLVVSNTFVREEEFLPYIELSKKYGYKFFTVVVENRHGGKNIHGVSEDKIEQMKNKFQIKLK